MWYQDIHPDVASASRESLKAAAIYGVGSPEHEMAKTTLIIVARRVLAEHEALRKELLP